MNESCMFVSSASCWQRSSVFLCCVMFLVLLYWCILFIANVIKNVKCTETLYISYNCTLFWSILFWHLTDPVCRSWNTFWLMWTRLKATVCCVTAAEIKHLVSEAIMNIEIIILMIYLIEEIALISWNPSVS